jgi:BirA family biotin operon repressor/biotin-[acetyl-CoA-carboxylase] ligase
VIRYVEETESTNEDAAKLLGQRAHAGLTIVAEQQHRGAGRKGRSWIAPPGSALLLTTILPDPIPASDLWIVPFWAALAVRRTLSRSGIEARLHWPNDLLVRGRKVAGILCTSRIVGDDAWVACGIGINVTRYEGADIDVVPPPAFCDDVKFVDRPTLLRALLIRFDATLTTLQSPQAVARRWEREASLPQRYRILKDGASEPFEATAMSIATGGALIVRLDGGRREEIALADARAIR